MRAKFIINKDHYGWFWTLVAPNGRTLTAALNYSSKAAAKNGIELVRKYATDAEIKEGGEV